MNLKVVQVGIANPGLIICNKVSRRGSKNSGCDYERLVIS